MISDPFSHPIDMSRSDIPLVSRVDCAVDRLRAIIEAGEIDGAGRLALGLLAPAHHNV